MANKTTIGFAPEPNDNNGSNNGRRRVRCTLTFDLSRPEDIDLVARLRTLAHRNGSGVTLTDDNTFLFT